MACELNYAPGVASTRSLSLSDWLAGSFLFPMSSLNPLAFPLQNNLFLPSRTGSLKQLERIFQKTLLYYYYYWLPGVSDTKITYERLPNVDCLLFIIIIINDS